METRVGILGMGMFLPVGVRKNDWWPSTVVDQWRRGLAPRGPAGPRSADPFMGALERRVVADDVPVAGIEVAAGARALVASGIAPGDVDLLLVAGMMLAPPIHPAIHRELALPPACMSLTTDSGGSSFLEHLTFAEQQIRGGRVRNALIVQSMLEFSPFLQPHDPLSAQLGQGAAAAVVGPTRVGRGLLGQAHCSDTAVLDLAPGLDSLKGDRASAEVYFSAYHPIMTTLCGHANELLDRALAEAQLQRKDIDFWASPQLTAWTQSDLRVACGLAHAAERDIFPWTGNLVDATVPLALALAVEDGQLRDGMTIAMFTAGLTASASCAILRWGT